MSDWQSLRSDLPELFHRLRDLQGAEVVVRFRMGIGEWGKVEVPAASLTLQGRLRVEAGVDRFGVEVPGWGADDFAWFARRKGRGRTDYWQAAIEHKPEGRPALILYLTAPVDGLEIQARERQQITAETQRTVQGPGV